PAGPGGSTPLPIALAGVARSLSVTLPALPVGLPVVHVLPRLVAVDVVVEIRVLVDVDVNVPAAPVAATPGPPPRRAHRHPDAERHQRRARHVSRWVVVVRRVSRLRP